MLDKVVRDEELSLFELVDSMPLALPIPKESVIIGTNGKKGGKIKFFTPDGYMSRISFMKWLDKNSISPQNWYDKYYLNILINDQRPKCKLDGCNEECEFNSHKSLGYHYLEFCCHSHCQIHNRRGEKGQEANRKLRTSLEKYFSNIENRKLRGEQTKNGFKKNGLYDLDENGLNHFSRAQYRYHSSDKGRANDKKRANGLRKENNPGFSETMKRVMNTPEVRERNSRSVRKAMSNPNLRAHLSLVRKNKYRTDSKFRNHQFRILSKISRGKSGYTYSHKCLNSKDEYVSYDSSYELAYILSLNGNNSVLEFYREPRNLGITYLIGEETHWYFPDFIVTYSDGHKELVEIKPKSLLSDPVVISKSSAAISWCSKNNMTYVVLTEDEIFSSITKEYTIRVHEYNMSLKNGFRSSDEVVNDMILNLK